VKNHKEKVFYILLSLLFSLILFVNVNGSNVQKFMTTTTDSYEQTAKNVPVTVDYNSDKYFIHGYAAEATVKLKSANRVQLSAESNENTRKFKLEANVTKLGVGTHEVKLKIKNLSSAVTGVVNPSTITVTVEKKVEKTLKVTPKLKGNVETDGMEVSNLVAEPNEVTITTGTETFKQIDQVVALVDASKIELGTKKLPGKIEAHNKAGEALNISTLTQTAEVTMNVQAPTQEVALYASQTGTPEANVLYYTITLDDQTTTISGRHSVIDDISQIKIPVDVTGIKKSTVKTITIPTADGYTADPESIQVQITPVFTTSTTSSSGSNTTSSSSNSTSSTTN
jgi:YbbR domain-containing protein